MRIRIVLGCVAVAVAAAGCGKATAGHQASSPQHITASSVPVTSVPATTKAPLSGPAQATSTGAPAPSAATSAAPAPTRAPAPTSSARPTAVAAGSRCRTSDLWAVFEPLGAAAGNEYGKILLTNHSGSTCTVYGYGGIGLVNSSGSVPTKQIRDTATPPATITLRPGDHAFSQLHWSDVSGTGESDTSACEPRASGLQVIPPDETRALDAHWTGSPACEHGQIRQTAYRAGTGPASGG